MTEEHKRKIGQANAISHLGLKLSDETKRKMSLARTGQKRTPEQISKMSNEHHPNWRGGITSINEKIRKSAQYKEWRRHVFNRDDYTCQGCGKRGVELHADHELPFALFSDLRLEILNGRTLCVPCHKKTNTFGAKTRWQRDDHELALLMK